MRDKRAIIIVAKQPIPGQVKTRLCPAITHSQASDLAAAFLSDTVSSARRIGNADVFIGYTGQSEVSARGWFSRAYPGVPLLSQGFGNLGERMSRLIDQAFDAGYEHVLLIGADTPHVGPGRYEAAFLYLAIPDQVVLGPSEDGGYYLVGISAPYLCLFEGIDWGTESVLQQTIDRIDGLGLKVGFLPMERDIDTHADLLWLSVETARLPVGSQTSKLLKRLHLL